MSEDFSAGFVLPDTVPSAAQPEPEPQPDVLDQLLDGADGTEAAELTDEQLGSLHEEFEPVARLRAEKLRLEAQLKRVSAALEDHKRRMLSALEAQGTRQFRSADGSGQCYTQTRYNVRVTDPEPFMEWVQENHPELLSVNSQTLGSFVRKEYRDKGVATDSDQFPPGIEVKEQVSLMVRDAAKPKEAS